jgi:hypothetical protein
MNAIDTWQDTSNQIDCLKAAGIKVVGRYYSQSEWKRLKPEEAQRLSAAGIEIFVVYQDSNNKYSKFTKEKRREAATRALNYATNTIKQPAGSAIYFAVDYDASPSEVDGKICKYFEGVNELFSAHSVQYKIGVYGNGAACKALLDSALVQFTWLSMSTGHFGHADFYASKRWSLCQKLSVSLCHMDVDPNELNPNVPFGGFRLDGIPLGPGAFPLSAVAGAAGTSVTGIPAGSITAYVKTDGLNLRQAPDGEIIRELTLHDPLEVTGNAVDNWLPVRAGSDSGFVFGSYVRQPVAPEIEVLLRNSVDQWIRFEKGKANEENSPYYTYVGEMWNFIGLNYDGRSKYPSGEEVPWSAAFISFVVGKSGKKYSDFKFDASHSTFVHDAIQARILDRTNRPFWGYRISERKPELGDIVARNRAGNSYSFDYAENHSSYKSHSDIVVEVGDHMIRVMGGNVGDTVSISSISGSDNLQEYDLDGDGCIKPGQKVIAILKNRALEV